MRRRGEVNRSRPFRRELPFAYAKGGSGNPLLILIRKPASPYGSDLTSRR